MIWGVVGALALIVLAGAKKNKSSSDNVDSYFESKFESLFPEKVEDNRTVAQAAMEEGRILEVSEDAAALANVITVSQLQSIARPAITRSSVLGKILI